MTSLLDFPSPPASAYGAKPLSPEEIDAHPDRDRLWATIEAMRGDMEDREIKLEEEHDQRRTTVWDEAWQAGYQEGFGDASEK